MNLEQRADAITMPCSCHESYKCRKLIDPFCAWHNYAADIVDALRAVVEACAEVAERYNQAANTVAKEGDLIAK